jgi:hypothetical protein
VIQKFGYLRDWQEGIWFVPDKSRELLPVKAFKKVQQMFEIPDV